MGKEDANYFMRRAAEELLAAEQAASPEAAAVHRNLYQRYCMMADNRPETGLAEVSASSKAV